jgi:hypothetical protein
VPQCKIHPNNFGRRCAGRNWKEIKEEEMKLEIGKQYKTRGGWRAVVVAGPDENSDYLVWHSDIQKTLRHLNDGSWKFGYDDRTCDLTEEWKEPRKGTLWVNIYPDNTFCSFGKKEVADVYKGTRIACVKVHWTDGEGL